MPFAIFALAAVNLAVGTQGFAFAGLLPEIAGDLSVTIGQAGMLVAATTITFAIGAPFAASVTARQDPRKVIIAALGALTIVNALCVLAPNFAVLLGLRIAAGVVIAFLGALASVTAAALAPTEKRGRAFAIVMGGMTIAFLVTVPLGSAIGGAFGWRSTFLFAALVSALAVALIIVSVPPAPAAGGEPPRLRQAFANPVVTHTLALTLLAFTAMFTVVAYIGPIITYATGATGAGIGAMQVFVGLGSIAGLTIGGMASDRGFQRKAANACFAAMVASLLCYWLVLTTAAGTTPKPVLAMLIFSGATSLFALIPLGLARISIHAGTAAPIALAVNSSLISLGQGVGALWGGFLADTFGQSSLGPGGALIAAAALALAIFAKPASG